MVNGCSLNLIAVMKAFVRVTTGFGIRVREW
jgi:hypothetical protein